VWAETEPDELVPETEPVGVLEANTVVKAVEPPGATPELPFTTLRALLS
jgi:hypothetical protein